MIDRIATVHGSDNPHAALPPRERILVAARELFYRHGLHSVGVEGIAEAAGTNKMTLYRHFASKDLLIAECMRDIVADFEAGWKKVSAACAPDPMSQLMAWVDFSFDPIRKQTDRGCALANAAVQLPDKDHPAKRVIENSKRRFREMTVQLCRNAGIDDPEMMADELFLLCEGAQVSMESVGWQGPAARLPLMIRSLIERHSHPA